MMIIDGYRTYLYYQALRFHFTRKDFDAIKNNGRVKIPKSKFESRNDKVVFDRIAKKLKEDHIIASFMIANFVSDNKDFIHNFERAMTEYTTWKKRKESLSYLFKVESAYLETVLSKSKNIYSTLLRELINKKISPETFVALDTFYNIFNSYTQEFLWSEYELLLTKYKSFVKIKEQHKQHFSNIEHYFINNKFSNETETSIK